MDSTFMTLISPVVVKDCDEESKDRNPYLRGLAVDSRGTVYAAANGCHRVVKITPDGKVETVLKAERPWSPTGVAVFGEDVYVLEFTNSLKGPNEGEGWQPRVRKLGRDGKVTTLATQDKMQEPPKKVPDGVYAVRRESIKQEPETGRVAKKNQRADAIAGIILCDTDQPVPVERSPAKSRR